MCCLSLLLRRRCDFPAEPPKRGAYVLEIVSVGIEGVWLENLVTSKISPED